MIRMRKVRDIAAGPDVLTRLAASESGTPVDPLSGCMTFGDGEHQGIRLSRIPEDEAERPGERLLRWHSRSAATSPAATAQDGWPQARCPPASFRLRSFARTRQNCGHWSRDLRQTKKTAKYGKVRTEFFSGLDGGSATSTLTSDPPDWGLVIEVFRWSRRVFFLHRVAFVRRFMVPGSGEFSRCGFRRGGRVVAVRGRWCRGWVWRRFR